MQNYKIIFLLFIIYSFIGWSIETLLSFISQKKFINRGFLIGPYCPVYGIGAIFILILLNKYYDDPIVLFILSMFMCSFIEYITSYIMEKLFKARWWDYSHIPFNINGRICMSNAILFGLGSLLIVMINPIILDYINKIPTQIVNDAFCIILTIFLIDFICSFKIIKKLKMTSLELKHDNTDVISERVYKVLKEKSGEFKRLLDAFPNATIIKRKKK